MDIKMKIGILAIKDCLEMEMAKEMLEDKKSRGMAADVWIQECRALGQMGIWLGTQPLTTKRKNQSHAVKEMAKLQVLLEIQSMKIMEAGQTHKVWA